MGTSTHLRVRNGTNLFTMTTNINRSNKTVKPRFRHPNNIRLIRLILVTKSAMGTRLPRRHPNSVATTRLLARNHTLTSKRVSHTNDILSRTRFLHRLYGKRLTTPSTPRGNVRGTILIRNIKTTRFKRLIRMTLGNPKHIRYILVPNNMIRHASVLFRRLKHKALIRPRPMSSTFLYTPPPLTITTPNDLWRQIGATLLTMDSKGVRIRTHLSRENKRRPTKRALFRSLTSIIRLATTINNTRRNNRTMTTLSKRKLVRLLNHLTTISRTRRLQVVYRPNNRLLLQRNTRILRYNTPRRFMRTKHIKHSLLQIRLQHGTPRRQLGNELNNHTRSNHKIMVLSRLNSNTSTKNGMITQRNLHLIRSSSTINSIIRLTTTTTTINMRQLRRLRHHHRRSKNIPIFTNRRLTMLNKNRIILLGDLMLNIKRINRGVFYTRRTQRSNNNLISSKRVEGSVSSPLRLLNNNILRHGNRKNRNLTTTNKCNRNMRPL